MTLDPQARLVLDMAEASDRPQLYSLSPEEARAEFAIAIKILDTDPPAVAEIRDIEAPGPAGPVPIRLYRPHIETGGPLPVLVFYHGGGFVIGDRDTYETPCRTLANQAGCLVASVDYRLAPEYKFPAAVDDAWAALTWIAANAAGFGGDAARLAVGGDSAGGNLSSVMARMARDAGGPDLALQMLIYPATRLDGDTDSHRRLGEGYFLTRELMNWFMDHYLNGPEDLTDLRASPGLAEDLGGLAPAYVVTAGYDPLSDEGEAYAAGLSAAGVPVETRRFDGQIHGFLSMGKVIEAAGTCLDECATALRRAWR